MTAEVVTLAAVLLALAAEVCAHLLPPGSGVLLRSLAWAALAVVVGARLSLGAGLRGVLLDVLSGGGLGIVLALLSWAGSRIAPAGDLSSEIPPGFVGALVVIVLAPLGEELLFRGALLRLWVERHGPVVGALLVAVLFGLFHPGVVHLPLAVLAGLALAWLRLARGSLLPCVLAHAIVNAAVFLQ